MRLGWMDKTEAKTINYLPKKDTRYDMFGKETRANYARRFFGAIAGLGNIWILKNNRIIGSRNY